MVCITRDNQHILGIQIDGSNFDTMAAFFAPSRGAITNVASKASNGAITLPGFLIPAWQPFATRQRHFSISTPRASKLGRTPISVPPGVELVMGEPITKRIMTSYQPIVTKTVTVTGPLGSLRFLPPTLLNLILRSSS